MLKNVRIAIGVALLLLAGFAGYRFGAWRLDKAQAEIARLEQAGNEALKSAQAAQAKVEAQLQALSTEQAAKEQAMSAKFEADRKGLDRLLDTAGTRTAQLEGQKTEAERKRLQLQKELDELRRRAPPSTTGDTAAPNANVDPAASDAARAALQAEADRQAAEVRRLTEQIAGLKCEDAVVPDEEVTALNRAALAVRADATGAPQ